MGQTVTADDAHALAEALRSGLQSPPTDATSEPVDESILEFIAFCEKGEYMISPK